MAMAVRSRRFFGPVALVAGTVTLLYTVPSDRTAIFRSVPMANYGAAAAVCQLRVNGTAATNDVFIGSIPTVATVGQNGALVLGPGDTLNAVSAAGSTIVVSGFGSLLDGVPT